MSDTVRLVVLGGPIPATLREGLGDAVVLVTEGHDDADGVLLYANGDVFPAVRKFRISGGVGPLYGWSETPVDMRQRLAWIREGADDLLYPEIGAAAILRRVRGETRRSVGRAEVGLRIDRYLEAIRRYVAAREALMRGLGDGGRARYLDCTFQRDQVMRASDAELPTDAFGQRRGGEREELAWPAQVVAPYQSVCRILNIGPDGLCLSLPQAPSPGQALRVVLEGASASLHLDLEVRWQRRIGRDRWEAGALVTACGR